MDVALDRADHDLSDRFGTGLSNQRAQDDERALHGARRDQHLGNEEVAFLEPATDFLQRWDQRLEQDVHRIHAELQRFLGQGLHFGCVPVQGVIEKFLSNLLFPTHAAPPVGM
jgi:hypothetical protein